MSYWQRITESRLSRRRALAGAATIGAGAAALAVVGCGGDGSGGGASGSKPDLNKLIRTWEAPDETSGAKAGGLYRGARTADASSMDPFTSTTTTTDAAIGTVYETMLVKKFGPGLDPNADLDLEGRLAESWEVRDANTIVFRLRQNARFHDVAPVSGRLMDIDDVKLSFERFVARSTRAATMKEFLDKAEFPDSRTMVVKLKDPYADTELLFTGFGASPPILPKEALDGRFDPTKTAIGTGYTVLSSYQPSIKFDYKKNPSWWRTGRPFIDAWTYAVVPEYAQRLAQFLVGNILEFTPTQQDVLQTLKDAKEVKSYAVDPTGSYQFIWFGQGKNATDRFALDSGMPWMDKRVRQAMSMSIDRKALNDHFANAGPFIAEGLPIAFKQDTHVMAQRASYWLDPDKNELGDVSKFYKYDVAEAKKLMSAAGFASGIDIDMIFNTGNQYGAEYHERVELTSDMLTKSGLFRPKRVGLVYEDYFNNYRNPPRKFSGMAFGASGSYGNLDLEIFNSFHTKGGTFKGYQDQKIDDLRGLYQFTKRKPLGAVGGFLVLLLVFMAIFGAGFSIGPVDVPSIAPQHYKEYDLSNKLASPSWSHIMGTDHLGRDVFSRLLYGARLSVFIGLGVFSISTVISTSLTLVSGYYVTSLDLFLQRFIEVIGFLPDLVLLTAIMAIYGASPYTFVITLGLLNGFNTSRVLRAMVIGLRGMPYIESAKAIGATDRRILVRHILPNVAFYIIVGATASVSGAIAAEAGLAIIGVGLDPIYPSWGNMMDSSRQYLRTAAHLAIFPAIMLALTIFGFRLLGDALRDVLDPRQRGAGK